MAYSSNCEPRRFWRSRPSGRERARCAACGGRAAVHSADLPFCTACLDWARPGNLIEWDDLGGGD